VQNILTHVGHNCPAKGGRPQLGRAFTILLAVVGLVPAILAQEAAFVGHNGGSDLSVIDLSTNTVSRTIATGGQVNQFDIMPDLSMLYVVVPGLGVQIIDPVTDIVVKTIPITGSIFGCRITPDGSYAFVTRGDPPTVFVIDTATNTIVEELPTVANAVYLDITPDGSKVYVATSRIFLDSIISVIDVATLSIMDVLDIGEYPAEMKVTPDGAYVYVSNEFANTVTILDTTTNTVVNTLPVGSGPRGLAFSPDGAWAYVITVYDTSMTIIDTAAQAVDHSVSLAGGRPFWIAVTNNGQTGYVTKYLSQSVAVFDLATETITTEIPLSGSPYDIALADDPSNPCPVGDLNGDGVVNLSDLAILLAHYGDTESVYRHGDIDADGDVDLSDLAALWWLIQIHQVEMVPTPRKPGVAAAYNLTPPRRGADSFSLLMTPSIANRRPRAKMRFIQRTLSTRMQTWICGITQASSGRSTGGRDRQPLHATKTQESSNPSESHARSLLK